MTTNGANVPGKIVVPVNFLVGVLVILAVVLVVAAVTLTLTGHSAQDAWWALGVTVSGLLGIHIPNPPS